MKITTQPYGNTVKPNDMVKIREEYLREKIADMAETLYDLDPSMKVDLTVYDNGEILVSCPYCGSIERRCGVYGLTERGAYVDEETEEEKKETLNDWEDVLLDRFCENMNWSDVKIEII